MLDLIRRGVIGLMGVIRGMGFWGSFAPWTGTSIGARAKELTRSNEFGKWEIQKT
jgi:hypothetical protein